RQVCGVMLFMDRSSKGKGRYGSGVSKPLETRHVTGMDGTGYMEMASRADQVVLYAADSFTVLIPAVPQVVSAVAVSRWPSRTRRPAGPQCSAPQLLVAYTGACTCPVCWRGYDAPALSTGGGGC